MLPVDRSRALVAALWRLGLACAPAAVLMIWDVRWRLLWTTDKATWLALATIFAALAAAALALLIPGIRWLVLSLWMGPLGIKLSNDGLQMNLGPFGRYDFDRRRLTIGIDRDIDAEMIDLMPDDAFLPVIRHPGAARDIAPIIQKFAGLESEKLTALLRPFLKRI